MTNELKKHSAIWCYDGIIAVFPLSSEEVPVETVALSQFEKCYAVNNGKLCFVEDNEVFVVPYNGQAISCLKRAGFRKENFYVPFSNGEYPKKVLSFIEERKKEENLVETCAMYIEAHGFTQDSGDVLRNDLCQIYRRQHLQC